MTTHIPSICEACRRLREGSLTCDAFPAGIPVQIRLFGASHEDPVPGDHGLQFAPDARKREAFRAWTRFSEPGP